MLLKTALTALALGCAGLASAQSRVLYDSRLPTAEPRITESERGRVKFLAGLAMQAGLWDSGEFGPSGDCSGEDFQINGVAPGSFTVKGAQQTAYLYMYCYYRPGWSQGLVITQGDGVVAHYVFTGLASGMYALGDINRNGFTELVLEGGFTGQGYTEGYLEIAELRPQRRLLGTLNYEFNSPYKDNCGTLDKALAWTSRVIRVTPGVTPQFTQQVIQGKCGNEQVATFTGGIQPLKLKPSPTGWTPAPTR
jgi:hypothetical protein